MDQKKILYLMRHGEAARGGVTDFERALSPRGRGQIEAQIEQFKKVNGIRPDAVFCSTAKRTKETAQILQRLFKGVPVFYRETLYLAPTGRLLDLVQGIDEVFARVLIIGHNPGLEQMVSLLDKKGALIPMGTADCVEMRLNIKKWCEVKAGTGEIKKIFLGFI